MKSKNQDRTLTELMKIKDKWEKLNAFIKSTNDMSTETSLKVRWQCKSKINFRSLEALLLATYT